MSEGWKTVSRREPCPVCHKPDWCGTADNGRVVHCMRVESDRPCDGGGWIHFMWNRPLPVRPAPIRRKPLPSRPVVDMEKVMQGFWREFEERHPKDAEGWSALDYLQEDLWLDSDALARLTPGRSDFYKAWCFPMRDGDGKVVGVRLREYVSGRKWSVAGSRDGLFYDPALEAQESTARGVRGRELVVCEGATDCAAAYSIGLPCVGRSSCATGLADLKRLCERLKANRITIVTDNDRPKVRPGDPLPFADDSAPQLFLPGLEGAERLARGLGRVYRIVTPPKKDLREWWYAGLTRQTFDMVASAQKWRMPAK